MKKKLWTHRIKTDYRNRFVIGKQYWLYEAILYKYKFV